MLVNGPAVGDRSWLWGTVRGYGGPSVVMLSAVDGLPGPSVAAMHGPGRPSMASALGPGGPIAGGTICSVTGHF